MRLKFCIIACHLAIVPALASAQSLGVESGAARDYIILKQPQRDHEVILRLRPDNPGAAPRKLRWERWDPNGRSYTEERRIRWHASASCKSGIDWISIKGPGGTEKQTLNGSRKAIAGRSNFESFDSNALDNVCKNWARQATQACGEDPTIEPGCVNQKTFHFGPNNPLPRSQVVEVNGRCENGSNLPRRQYTPRLALECRLEN